MNFEDGEIDKTKSEPAIEETTDDYWTGSGSGPEESDSNSTETKEALAHEASDQDTVSNMSSHIHIAIQSKITDE